MTTDDQSPDAATLCVSCGLCCKGVLYSNAKAQPDEVGRIAGAGLVVEQLGERLQFRLPCHHNVEGRCAIYEDRFSRCRSFRCALLKRVDSGEVALPQALELVAKAKAMVAGVAALDPESALVTRRVEVRRAGAAPEPAAARLWLESLALDMFLDRTFRNKPLAGIPPAP